MKRTVLVSRPKARALQILVWTAAVLAAACDNDVSFKAPRYNPPTAPLPVIEPVGNRSLQISGGLEAEGGSIMEATILYDGQELDGARANCFNPAGCAELRLAARTQSSSGRHTLSFQVLGQSDESVDYRVDGNVLVTREGIAFGGVNMRLGPKSATLRRGESVDFEILFTD